MAKSKGARGAGQSAVGEVERRARAVAEEMNLELVEVTLQKESRGKCLCVYVDKEGGLSLEKHRGELVEVRLFAARDGAKAFRGLLTAMDDATVTITGETEQPLVFQRREVAVVKPVIELDEDDFADVEFDALNDEE